MPETKIVIDEKSMKAFNEGSLERSRRIMDHVMAIREDIATMPNENIDKLAKMVAAMSNGGCFGGC